MTILKSGTYKSADGLTFEFRVECDDAGEVTVVSDDVGSSTGYVVPG